MLRNPNSILLVASSPDCTNIYPTLRKTIKRLPKLSEHLCTSITFLSGSQAKRRTPNVNVSIQRHIWLEHKNIVRCNSRWVCSSHHSVNHILPKRNHRNVANNFITHRDDMENLRVLHKPRIPYLCLMFI